MEVGGTVGDLESSAYFEAIRQMKLDLGEENVIIVTKINFFFNYY